MVFKVAYLRYLALFSSSQLIGGSDFTARLFQTSTLYPRFYGTLYYLGRANSTDFRVAVISSLGSKYTLISMDYLKLPIAHGVVIFFFWMV